MSIMQLVVSALMSSSLVLFCFLHLVREKKLESRFVFLAGLTERVLKSTVTEADAENQV